MSSSSRVTPKDRERDRNPEDARPKPPTPSELRQRLLNAKRREEEDDAVCKARVLQREKVIAKWHCEDLLEIFADVEEWTQTEIKGVPILVCEATVEKLGLFVKDRRRCAEFILAELRASLPGYCVKMDCFSRNVWHFKAWVAKDERNPPVGQDTV